jgi:bifunctional N-acetylglucosamine-1-phosphate-uridyltransferase/glucosamine-1-phosphate-acetyltransferase GlmU-like protein
VAGRGERLQQEHPKVRHEIVGDFIVRVVEKNIHLLLASMD